MRIFLAGGTGVIGRRLLPQLVRAGHQVTVMTRRTDQAQALHSAGAEVAIADVYDTAQLGQVIAKAKPDAVIHQMTALPQTIHPEKIEVEFAANDRVRTDGTHNLVSAAQGADVSRVVAQSIAFVYEPTGAALKRETDPLWLGAPEPFARTVAGVDTLERVVTGSEGIEGVVLRYGYFYGPGTAYAPGGSIAGMVATGQFPIVADGAGIFSFVHVDDAAAAAVASLGPIEPGVYNIVDDQPAPVSEWLPLYAEELCAPDPRRVSEAAGRAAGGNYGLYLMTQQRGASNAKAKRNLSWAPAHSWKSGLVSGD